MNKTNALEVRLLSYEDLSSVEQQNQSNNGCGKEYAEYLKVFHNNECILMASDAMEPEDCRFCRDLRWIEECVLLVYATGLSDGKAWKEDAT